MTKAKKPKDGFTLIVLGSTLILLFIMPMPHRKLGSTVCTQRYPVGDCITSYSWESGPSIFERLITRKADPSNKPDNVDNTTPEPTPTPTPQACGGFAGETGKFKCSDGYECQYPKPVIPDGQGICVKK